MDLWFDISNAFFLGFPQKPEKEGAIMQRNTWYAASWAGDRKRYVIRGYRMYIDDYLRLLLREMRENSTYSTSRNAWVISGLNAQIAFFEHVDQLPPELVCVQEVLEEGERRGLWKIDSVPELGTDIIAMK